jgi:hypothetical protein
MSGILESVYGFFGFGKRVNKEHQHAPIQGLTLAPKPEEKAAALAAAPSRGAVKESDGKRSNGMGIIAKRRLKAKRARQARKNARRAMHNPKHLMTRDVRLVA